jgi:TPP-dependent pyruvate/acetoin dehydrogenase alpha subunit
MQITRKGQGRPKADAKLPLADASTANGKFSLIPERKLMGLYTSLLRFRDVNQQLNGGANGKKSPASGREAALAATSIDLGAGDLVCCLEHGLLTVLSGENALESLMFDIAPHSGNGSLISRNPVNGRVAVPASASIILGTALANKTARNGKIAIVYSEANSDAWREAVHIASVHALPIIFVERLDGGSPRPRTDAPTRMKKNAADDRPWFPIITVDAHDVVAVYRVASEAMARARSGQGPVVIECQAFPLEAHGSDRERPHSHDPVQNMEHYLRMRGLLNGNAKSPKAGE